MLLTKIMWKTAVLICFFLQILHLTAQATTSLNPTMTNFTSTTISSLSNYNEYYDYHFLVRIFMLAGKSNLQNWYIFIPDHLQVWWWYLSLATLLLSTHSWGRGWGGKEAPYSSSTWLWRTVWSPSFQWQVINWIITF